MSEVRFMKEDKMIPKLKTDNFEVWIEQIRLALKARGLNHYERCDTYEEYCKIVCMELGIQELLFVEHDDHKEKDKLSPKIIAALEKDEKGDQITLTDRQKKKLLSERDYYFERVDSIKENIY
jgi:hypothetical protein